MEKDKDLTRPDSTNAVLRGCGMVLVGLAFLSLFLWQLSPFMYSTPDTPDEKNRVTHPSGFSVIAPDGWRSRLWCRGKSFAKDDRIQVYPNSRARLCERLVVVRITDGQGTEFSGDPPAQQQRHFAGSGEARAGQHNKYWVWSTRLPARRPGGPTHEVLICLPNDDVGGMTSVPDYWWPFVASVRTD